MKKYKLYCMYKNNFTQWKTNLINNEIIFTPNKEMPTATHRRISDYSIKLISNTRKREKF